MSEEKDDNSRQEPYQEPVETEQESRNYETNDAFTGKGQGQESWVKRVTKTNQKQPNFVPGNRY